MSSKAQALSDIIQIARANDLTLDDIEESFGRIDVKREIRSSSLVSRILVYLGGTFLFSGLTVFLVLNWDLINIASRIIATLGVGISFFVLAVLAHRDGRFTTLQTPFFLIAAVLQPAGILLLIDSMSSGGDWRYAALITSGVMTLQQGLTCWRRRSIAVVFTTVVFALWLTGTALYLLEIQSNLIAIVLGAVAVIISLILGQTAHRVITPLGYLAGSIYFFGGFFGLLLNTVFELFFIVVACGGVFLSVYATSRVLLLTSIAAMLGYVGYFTSTHFLNSWGWPAILALSGFVFIALSTLVVRIDNRYIRKR